MRADIEEVLGLQVDWTWRNTPEMQRRGVVVRTDMALWLRGELPALSRIVPPTVDDLSVEGRDGTGRKTRVPWVRVFSKMRSPSATEGFYIVYLFNAAGDQAYLSLNQGTTRWINGEFRARPESELRERVSWAKDKLINELADRPDLSETIDLGDGTSLGRGYEVGNVAAFEYRANTVPEEDQLRADLRFLVGVLGSLYVAVDSAISVPGEETPEVADIVALVDHVARPRRRRSVRGVIRLSAAERIVIEKRAVQVAIEQLRKLEYTSIKDVGATESYDLDAHRSGERLYVEVKGTTSDGSEVVLTKNEVELHVAQYPATMLIVVTGIELRRDADPVEASNGTPHVFHPWKIGAEDLTPIAFRYTVPLGISDSR